MSAILWVPQTNIAHEISNTVSINGNDCEKTGLWWKLVRFFPTCTWSTEFYSQKIIQTGHGTFDKQQNDVIRTFTTPFNATTLFSGQAFRAWF